MNRVALVTGASKGIGKAIALDFAKKGYNVAVNCNSNPSLGEDVVNQCRLLDVESDCFVFDVSDFEKCKEMVDLVKERFGSIDILVNNAGITKDGLLARMSEDSFDIVTKVNYKSVFNMIRHVSGIMIKQRKGRIINITSVSGLYGNAGQFNYSASKSGLIGMTLSAAKELGKRGITVNAVAPGFIETDMTNGLSDDVKQKAVELIAMGRFGKPEEIASVVSFLASEEASYLTGQIITVDGCMSM